MKSACVIVGLAIAIASAGCKPREHVVPATRDAEVFDKPVDHLGKNELVGAEAKLFGLPLPRGFAVVETQPNEGTATGRATVEEMRRHVLEHTISCVLYPEPQSLVWWHCEIPGQGAKHFNLRVTGIPEGSIRFTVSEQMPLVKIDGGSGEVLKYLGLDERGYPTGYDKLR